MDDSLLNMPDPRENEDERDSSDSPVAEILTSLPRYRSSLGLRTGPEHAGTHVKGNDPLDYEQRYAEDPRGEEMGPFARIWRIFLDECARFDSDMVDDWRDRLDVLLVFAGLFSAVVSTFVVQTSQNLQTDYNEVSASLLFELISVQRAIANGIPVNNISRSEFTPSTVFTPSILDSWVNWLFFTSLSLSLSTASVAVLTKQWIYHYISVPSGTPRDRSRIRHFRYMGLRNWHVPVIIGLLPVLMHASLGLFLLGLVVYLAPLHIQIAYTIGAMSLLTFFAYFATTFLPLFYAQCPYKTPLSAYAYPLYSQFCHVVLPKLFRVHSAPSARVSSMKKAEALAVNDNVYATDARALAWLHSMSSNPIVRSISIQSMSALSLKSTSALKSELVDVAVLCQQEIKRTFESEWCPDNQDIMEAKAERVFRAYLRFRAEPGLISWPFPRRPHLDIHTQLVSFGVIDWGTAVNLHPTSCQYLRATIVGSPKEQVQRQQPIIWAHILKNVLLEGVRGLLCPESNHFDVHLYRKLLQAFPQDFWSPSWTDPPLAFRSNAVQGIGWQFCPQIEILDVPGCDSPVPFTDAIHSCLYPYLAKLLIEHFTGGNSRFSLARIADRKHPVQIQLLLAVLELSCERTWIWNDAGLLVSTVLACLEPYLKGMDADETDREGWSAIFESLCSVMQSDAFGTIDSHISWPDQRSILESFTMCLMKLDTEWEDASFCTSWPVLARKIIQTLLEDRMPQIPMRAGQIFSHRLIAPYMYETFVRNRCFDRIRATPWIFHFLVVEAYVDGLEHLSDTIDRQSATQHLLTVDNLLIAFKFVAASESEECLQKLARIRPRDPVWEEVFDTFDNRTSDEEFWTPYVYDYEGEGTWERFTRMVADFRVSLTGCASSELDIGESSLHISTEEQLTLSPPSPEGFLWKWSLWRRRHDAMSKIEWVETV